MLAQAQKRFPAMSWVSTRHAEIVGSYANNTIEVRICRPPATLRHYNWTRDGATWHQVESVADALDAIAGHLKRQALFGEQCRLAGLTT